MSFFDHPILNSQYFPPLRHWELDENGRPTDRILTSRRSSALWIALPEASAQSSKLQMKMSFDDGLSTDATEYNPSPYVNELRQELEIWRAIPSSAQWMVAPVTQRLLQHWRQIQRDDAQVVRPFFCQLEAVEAAIWLSEVAPEIGKRGRRFLDWISTANNFAVQPEGAEPSSARPGLLRIAFKLASGAGKTTVMAMLIAWQALNAVRSSSSRRFSRGFLVIAPGITIRGRLRVLLPNDADSYYASSNLVPHDLLPDLNRAKVVITNYHAFKLRETFEGARVSIPDRNGAIARRDSGP
jgi:type III restriction enzyme